MQQKDTKKENIEQLILPVEKSLTKFNLEDPPYFLYMPKEKIPDAREFFEKKEENFSPKNAGCQIIYGQIYKFNYLNSNFVYLSHLDSNSWIMVNEDTVSFWDVQYGFLKKIDLSNGLKIYKACLLSNKHLVITYHKDINNKIDLLDLEKGCIVNSFFGHGKYVDNLCKLSNTKFFSSSGDQTTKLWHIDKQYEVSTIKMRLHNLQVNKNFLIGCYSNQLIVWDLDKESLVIQKSAHNSLIKSIAVKDNQIFTAAEDKTIKNWNFSLQLSSANLEEIGDFKGHKHHANHLLICNEEIISYSGSDFFGSDNTIRLWTKDGTCKQVIFSEDLIKITLITGEQTYLICAYLDGTIQLFNKIENIFIEKEIYNQPIAERLMCLDTNKLLVYAGKYLYYYDLHNPKNYYLIKKSNKSINLVGKIENSDYFYTVSNNIISIWKSDKNPIFLIDLKQERQLIGLYKINNTTIVGALDSGMVFLLNMKDLKIFREFKHFSQITSLIVLSDNTCLIGCKDKKLYRLDADKNEILFSWNTPHPNCVGLIHLFSQRTFATADKCLDFRDIDDGKVCVFSLEKTEPVYVLNILSLLDYYCFYKNYIFVFSMSHISCFDLNENKQVMYHVKNNKYKTTFAKVIDKGKTICEGSQDGGLFFWDTKDGYLISSNQIHNQSLNSVVEVNETTIAASSFNHISFWSKENMGFKLANSSNFIIDDDSVKFLSKI